MDIIFEDIRIRDIELEDVYLLRSWGQHKDPLFEDYNFPDLTDREIELWHRAKTGPLSNRYFGVWNEEGRLVGYMGVKDLKRYIFKTSTLGIVFDPNYLDRGYGTKALYGFLDHYFRVWKMRSMILEVAEFNQRAHRVYKKLAFKEEGYYLDLFPNQKLDLTSPYYKEKEAFFVIDGEKIYNYIYKMRLRKKDFLRLDKRDLFRK